MRCAPTFRTEAEREQLKSRGLYRAPLQAST